MKPSPSSPSDQAVASSEERTYSPEEAMRLREVFAPVAEESRRRNRITVGWFLALIAVFFLSVVLPKAAAPFMFFVLLGMFVKTAHSLLSSPRPKCPGCAGELTPVLGEEFGRYCPDCGNRSLEKAGWFSPCLCHSCGKNIGKGRRSSPYRTRACIHCGLWLDEAGL